MNKNYTMYAFDNYIRLHEGRYTNFKIREAEILFSGDSTIIETFYKNTHALVQNQETNNFWNKVDRSFPKISSGLAKNISNTMANLLFPDAPEIKIEGLSDEDLFLNDSTITNLLHEAVITESYSGEVGIKFTVNSNLSDKPIMEVYPASKLQPRYEHGILVSLSFIDTYTKKEGRELYELHTICTAGLISYKLYKDDKEVSIDSIEETANLKPVAFTDKSGAPIKFIPALYKLNNNGRIYSSTRGLADYSSAIEELVQLDELHSSRQYYIRNTTPKIFLSENLLQKDLKTGESLPFKMWTGDPEIIYGFEANPNNDMNKNSIFNRDIPSINLEPYNNTIRELTSQIVVSCGLSPATIGIQENVGANSTAEALKIRERVSIRTRDSKIALWRPALNEFAKVYLLYTELLENVSEIENGYNLVSNIDFDTLEIVVNFPDYISTSFEEKVNTYSNGLGVLYTHRYAIEQIFKDELTEDEIEEMILKLGYGIELSDKKIEDPIIETEKDETNEE